MELRNLGWNGGLDPAFDPHRERGCLAGRVAVQHRDLWGLLTGSGECDAVVSGHFRHDAASPADFPAVGDWVAALPAGGDGPAVIHAVLPRRSCFSRRAAGTVPYEQVIAANVDILFVVSGLDGNHNLRRLERYVAQAWDSGVAPVILLNKADLCTDVDTTLAATRADLLGVDVHAVSGARGDGMDELAAYLEPGRTVAFVGSSGVGKSTLVNRIVGGPRMATHAVRAGAARGRHTTSHRELIPTAAGALLIDTPGMREFALWADGDDDDGATPGTDDLDAFADIERLARRCRFPDCQHTSEAGCQVTQAVLRGDLDPRRVRSYRVLAREREAAVQRAPAARRPDADSKRRAQRAERRQARRHLLDDLQED